MKTVYSKQSELHDAQFEFLAGRWVRNFENSDRAKLILSRISDAQLGPVLEADRFGTEPLQRVHSNELLVFLENAWSQWSAENGRVDAFPNIWPAPRASRNRPRRIAARLGQFCTDLSTPILEGSWPAATASANTALTGMRIAMGADRTAFALCRPPGHHAGYDYFGGYCFLNNASIAAQYALDRGAKKAAVLDIDYHHGNGTQDIFYRRSDVLTISLHANPEFEYPDYSGYSEEMGADQGRGFNLNIPFESGTDYEAYRQGLTVALKRISDFGADVLIVSLGVDTFGGDPISKFKLQSNDFRKIGEQISSLYLPSLFVLEGGYAVDDIGINVVNVLEAFEAM